jgi:drug/metabolite transporter (DMT)-like permease
MVYYVVLGILVNIYSFGYVMSANYTIMSHAMTFCNLGSFTMLAYRFARRLPIAGIEVVGLLITLLGCMTIIQDPHAAKAHHDS